MEYSGRLERVGASTTNTGNGLSKIDSITIQGHSELRNVVTTRYLEDHLRDVLGQDCSIAVVSNTLCAIRHAGGHYEDVTGMLVLKANLWKLLLAWPALFAIYFIWGMFGTWLWSVFGAIGNVVNFLVSMPLYAAALLAPAVAFFFFRFKMKAAAKKIRAA